MYASEESSVNVPSGNFKGNEALDGGVVYVGENAALGVHRGVFTGNLAENGGGVFWTEDGGDIEVNIFFDVLFEKLPGRCTCEEGGVEVQGENRTSSVRWILRSNFS